jgi:phage tail sheath protein FI
MKEVAFIVGDTPVRLKPDGASITTFATNAANGNTESGVSTFNPYVGMYYPWGLSTNVDGNEIMVPPSTIALRTLAYNDSVSYQWMAPAGYTRGLVTNASSVGYLDDQGEFKAALLNNGQRDLLYSNKINPIAYIPNRGLVMYGQKTRHNLDTALDRINVARLINYLRYNLDNLSKPFLFEPNDFQTRDAVRTSFERFLADLVGLRGLHDFVVVCDESNNTPERIDRHELWVDIAIQPVQAIEFIYIPVRIVATGDDLGALFQ